MKIFILCIVTLLFFSSCSNTSMQTNEDKLDAPLKIKLKELTASGENNRVAIIGKCYEDISESIKAEIKETGAGVQSVIKNIFTAEATAEQISRLSNMDVIISMELSQKSDLK